MIQRQFVSIFTLSDTEFGREQHHLKRSEFVFRRAIGPFQFFHHTGASDRQGPGRLVSRMGLRRGRPARAVTGWDGFCSKVVFELLSV